MNEKQKRVFEYVKSRMEEGFAPSIREICAALDIHSTSTAARYVNNLVAEGYLEKVDGCNRAIKLAGKGAVKVPLVGTITAGQPITAVEDITDYINFHEPKNYSGELFALKVRGESMINAAILDGDIVVIEKCPVVSNGEIAAVMVGGEEATVKTFYKENGHYRLQPENDTMDPIIVDECEIIGRVVSVIRYI
ncbi:MAG: transcriptional repressor LexA [Oscillospiraceae bacterium]|nr:transcriptional repressor LexA [Ruminococcus sp.]MDE6596937.1 transcriptional repressor LexA [Oscillospiraceae bacterium]MDE6709332.1 transcriptional repressor LexA [Oscillospiraceae bacterium]MDE7289438.1 transcriptional repressor LexA [Oscillospiraceae bacterium]